MFLENTLYIITYYLNRYFTIYKISIIITNTILKDIHI